MTGPKSDENVFVTSFQCFQHKWDLEFFVRTDITLKYYSPNPLCKLCDFIPQNKRPDSTPRDLLLAFASGSLSNIVLFVRTLRSTHSQASITILLEEKLHVLLNQSERAFLRQCGCQIIYFNLKNQPKTYLKNFLFQLSESFIRVNQHKIDRVMICDLFDVVFQGDPFHKRLPRKAVHMIDETLTLQSLPGAVNRKWINAVDPKFNFTQKLMNWKYFCSGYMCAEVSLMLQFLDIFLQDVPLVENSVDQGVFNYAYLTGHYDKAGVPIANIKPCDYIAHVAGSGDRGEEFPYASDSVQTKTPALVVHHYYLTKYQFFKSLVKACPRPDYTFKRYLSKDCDFYLDGIEKELNHRF